MKRALFALLLGTSNIAFGQSPEVSASPVVVPAQFATAHKMFMAYGGAPVLGAEEPQIRSTLLTDSQSTLSSGAHLHFVATPEDADLACVLSVEAKNTDVTNGNSIAFTYVRLAIFDPKTHTLLWNLDASLDGAYRKKTFEGNLRRSVTKLAADFNALAAGKLPGAQDK